MAYTKRDDIIRGEGWTVVQLDTGALVAVRCDRKRVDVGVNYHATAEAIDAVGTVLVDANNRPLRTELKHSVRVERVDELGDGIVTRECLWAVLGEPVSLFAWPESWMTAVSIRVSLSAAQVAGAADAGAVL